MNTNNYFNLHVNGIGYINRIRWVTPRTGGRNAAPFLACSISALRGDSKNPSYTYFDLRVSGSEAIQMVEQLQQDVEEQRKVVVAFRIGDIYPHMYERNNRDTGRKEMAVLTKGRLLQINSITIDGNNVYRREEEDTSEGEPFADNAEAQNLEEALHPTEQVEPEPVHRRSNPQRNPQPVQQSQARFQQDQRPAYQRGYAAGHATRQGVRRFANA